MSPEDWDGYRSTVRKTDLGVARTTGAYGAARLGMMAATGAGAEIATMPPIARSIAPDRALKSAFDDGHARYCAARTAIQKLAH